MTQAQAQQLREENETRDKIAQAIADIRITAINEWVKSYQGGYITASEFLQLTDNIWQNELKQAQFNK